MDDAAVVRSANVEQFPEHLLESAANRLPPGPDARVTPQDRSLGLRDHRGESDVLGRQRQERVRIARVNCPKASLRQTTLLGVLPLRQCDGFEGLGLLLEHLEAWLRRRSTLRDDVVG
jgi:hypothetical protein